MLIVHVHVRVRPDAVEPFRRATIENARHSVEEPGIARFDVVQQIDDPTAFRLLEAYRSPEAREAHRQTPHYQVWRETVEGMMASARTRVEFVNVFPGDEGW